MPYLEKTLRRQLATTIDKARLVAEEGAADAIRRLAVADPDAPAWLSEPDCMVRRMLRAHARSLGDTLDGAPGCTRHLIETAAFEHWHRMLFGRFLVERGLLIHPTLGAAIAREELAELAADEGLPDAWALVERIAAPALPAVFKPHDPALQLPLAPEYAKRLRDLVAGLPEAVFEADDALGWTYQFWRAAEKERVNKAGGKIGAAELPVVTQLFTEPYMVRFLLHNTLGAWHAGRILAADPALAQNAPDEAALRAACALPGYDWEFLRFVRSDEPAEAGSERTGLWRPAAGTYPGWPGTAAEITMLDPCCGSGHFLTEALAALSAMRGTEERLSPADAVAAVLRDNLHGLEIDGRCVQIGAFALALTAWRIGGPALAAPGALPTPHVAWVGAPPPLPRAEFMDLADGDTELRSGLAALHDLFVQSPLLGSLIELTGGDLLDPIRMGRIESSMTALVNRMRGAEPERAGGVLAARGMADAAVILAKRFVLQATNVPFLAFNKMTENMAEFVSNHLQEGKSDLSTSFIQSMGRRACEFGSIAVVSPQTWYELGSYSRLRQLLFRKYRITMACDLGPAAFRDMNWWAARTALTIISNSQRPISESLSAFAADIGRTVEEKINSLSSIQPSQISQSTMAGNPDQRISMSVIAGGRLLAEYADSWEGLTTGDLSFATQLFWEKPSLGDWRFLNGSIRESTHYAGREQIIRWGKDGEGFLMNESAVVKGREAFGKKGVRISQMRHLPATLYDGECVDKNGATIVPKSDFDLPAIWCFCSSFEFYNSVRLIDKAVKVTTATLVKVPFDLGRWQKVAIHKYPNGLPKPYSDDPTQWLFHGHPAHAEPGTELHVALARLVGYRWPAETDTEMRLALEAREKIAQATNLPAPDGDGLLPLHAHGADPALADRLRMHLAAAFGAPLSPEAEAALVRAADSKLDDKAARDATLEAWLRDRAFRQHSALFHNRPFLWHVWDGLPRDGFSVFLHYHRLDHTLLEKLTYTVLGDWISRTAAARQVAQNEAARGLRQRLEAILHGEAPHDIFVRWKPPARQPIGWTPDLDDGVRLNIRPFMKAGVLREPPRGIAWGKDRGTDVPSAPWSHLGPIYSETKGARINDHHLTLADKHAARSAAPLAAD